MKFSKIRKIFLGIFLIFGIMQTLNADILKVQKDIDKVKDTNWYQSYLLLGTIGDALQQNYEMAGFISKSRLQDGIAMIISNRNFSIAEINDLVKTEKLSFKNLQSNYSTQLQFLREAQDDVNEVINNKLFNSNSELNTKLRSRYVSMFDDLKTSDTSILTKLDDMKTNASAYDQKYIQKIIDGINGRSQVLNDIKSNSLLPSSASKTLKNINKTIDIAGKALDIFELATFGVKLYNNEATIKDFVGATAASTGLVAGFVGGTAATTVAGVVAVAEGSRVITENNIKILSLLDDAKHFTQAEGKYLNPLQMQQYHSYYASKYLFETQIAQLKIQNELVAEEINAALIDAYLYGIGIDLEGAKELKENDSKGYLEKVSFAALLGVSIEADLLNDFNKLLEFDIEAYKKDLVWPIQLKAEIEIQDSINQINTELNVELAKIGNLDILDYKSYVNEDDSQESIINFTLPQSVTLTDYILEGSTGDTISFSPYITSSGIRNFILDADETGSQLKLRYYDLTTNETQPEKHSIDLTVDTLDLSFDLPSSKIQPLSLTYDLNGDAENRYSIELPEKWIFKIIQNNTDNITIIRAIKKTGQVTSYTNFDDGYYQVGVNKSYTRDDSYGIVTDNVTGLIWQDNEVVQKSWITQENHDAGKNNDSSGDTAINYCKNLTLGGFTDWELPTLNSLLTIKSDDFFHYKVGRVWSRDSSIVRDDKANILNNNYPDYYGKEGALDVKCVRGNLNKELVRSDEIVIDLQSGLMWQDDINVKIKKFNFYDSINYCKNLSLNNYSDWRIPNINELYSILDFNLRPAINEVFQNVASLSYNDSYIVPDIYVSSSTIEYRNNWIYNIRAEYGFPAFTAWYSDYYNAKTTKHYVRCVRGGVFEKDKNISFLSENPKDYEIKTTSFEKSWQFSENISSFSIEVVDNTYSNTITESDFTKEDNTLTLNLTPSISNTTNKLTLKFKDENGNQVKVSGSNTFWSLTKTNTAPRLADGQITQLVSATNEGAFLEIETYDSDGDDVTLTIEDDASGYVGFDPENLNRIFASFSDGEVSHTIKIGLSDGKEKVIKEFNVLQFDTTSIDTFYSDVDKNSTEYDYSAIAFGTLKGVIGGQPDPEDSTKRIFRPTEDASLAEALAIIINAQKKAGLITLRNDNLYREVFPSWAQAYYTYAVDSDAIDKETTNLAEVHPTRETIAKLVVKTLGLDEKAKYITIDESFTDESSFSDGMLYYAKIAKSFGIFMNEEAGNPQNKISRADLSKVISKIFMIPQATLTLEPNNIQYGDSVNLTLENIIAHNINNEYNLYDAKDQVISSFLVSSSTLTSPLDTNTIPSYTDKVFALLENNGVKNVISGDLSITIDDQDNDGLEDSEDKWIEDNRYTKDENGNGIPDLLDNLYGLSSYRSSDTIEILNSTYAITDIIRDGGIIFTSLDTDNDGIPDNEDTDIGNNGIDDSVEQNQSNFIERFYQNIMGRTADEGGMNTWLNTIQNESATKVALGFFKSQEFINKNLSNEQFVDILYTTLFDREADSAGRTDWLNKLNNNQASKDEVMYGFFNATEFKNLADRFGVTQIRDEDQLNPYSTTGVDGYVNRFYTLVLNRTPDDGGFNDWTTQLNAGTKGGGDIAKGFFNSTEYTNRNLDNSTFLDICYKAFFDRDADEGGKSNWTTLLNQGASKDEVLNGFIGSVEFASLAESFGIKTVIDDNTESPIVSVISGKQIIAHDSYVTVTSKFYANGNYSELGNDSVDGPWSCSGRWKDLGNNKIGATCDDNGATYEPDGIISLDGDEIHMQFNTDTVSVGNRITITGNEETFNLIVDSFGDINDI